MYYTKNNNLHDLTQYFLDFFIKHQNEDLIQENNFEIYLEQLLD